MYPFGYNIYVLAIFFRSVFLPFLMGFVHYLRGLQISFFTKTFIKNWFFDIFTYLKIILLQYFQFYTFNKINDI